MTSPLPPHELPGHRGHQRGRTPAGKGGQPRRAVWRVRTTVGAAPGSPALVCAGLAAHHTEFARAGALVEHVAPLGDRVPRGTAAPARHHNEVTVRRAGPGDLPAATALHARCSAATLALRYHGPAADADRYLPHLLSLRFGHSLAAVTACGRLAGLGHLLWDGANSEVALLVEDAWQRRGIGTALLRGLVEIAARAGRDSVYAVTRPAATGMIAAMRGLGLPLEYQGEGGTLVVTATLPAAGDGPRAAALPWVSGRR